jgi:hypothetical protein
LRLCDDLLFPPPPNKAIHMLKILPLGKLGGKLFRTSLVAGLLLSSLTIVSAAVTTNYFSDFESPTYTAGIGLDNQNGWTGLMVGTNGYTYAYNTGNGVISPGLGGSGQAAYVGLTPMPTAPNNYLDLWADFAFDPITNGTPIVKFSTKVKLNDSSNGNYDRFYFQFYNNTNALLFSLKFDNRYYPGRIYGLNSSSFLTTNYTTFQVGVEYSLLVTMNFASNTYSATLTNLSTSTGVTMFTSLPITSNGSQLTLDSADVIWLPSNPATPGDNQFIFDDYLVTSEPQTLPAPPNPTIGVLTYTPGNSATIRLTGQSGYNYAVDYCTSLGTGWIPLATNTVSGTYVDFPDPGAASAQSRCYRGRWVP